MQLAQLTGGAHQGGPIRVELLREVFSDRENAWMGYLLAWIFSSGGADAFAVVPGSADEVAQLADLVSPSQDRDVVHVITGRTIPAPVGSPAAATGLPAVQACQLMSFNLEEFSAGLPRNEASSPENAAKGRKTTQAEFERLVRSVFMRLTNGAAVPGFTAEQQGRAYAAVQYPAFYHAIRQEQDAGKLLTGVYARHSHSADRRLVAVGFTVRDPQTDMTDGWECLVDVTEPCLHFLATGLRRVYA